MRESPLILTLTKSTMFSSPTAATEQKWVWEWLVPCLSNAGLKVATERDFSVGTPQLINVSQVVRTSYQVILVLTPAWVKDSWANFEALLAQHKDPIGQRPRILPILLTSCDLPAHIDILTRADFTGREDQEIELARLLRALGREPDGSVIPDWRDTQALVRYTRYVVQTHGRLSFLFIKPAGSRGQAPIDAELETVFVPLQVEGHNSSRAISIDEALVRYPLFLLKGPPGYGKTTLLRHLAVCFARGEAAARLGWSGAPLLPILVPLRNFGRYLNAHQATCINPAPALCASSSRSTLQSTSFSFPLVSSTTACKRDAAWCYWTVWMKWAMQPSVPPLRRWSARSSIITRQLAIVSVWPRGHAAMTR